MLKVFIVVYLLFQLVHSESNNAYVIEFNQPINTVAAKRSALSKRSIFYQQLEAHHINYTIRHEYHVINAISIQFNSTQDSTLFFEKTLDIKKSWPVNTITKPSVYKTKSENQAISSLFGLYNATGITRVRTELGITGKGVKVGIIDTGVDYTHPALGGCFGPDCRVAYGYDFVGDAYNGENVPIPSGDPKDTCNGHGTHVTGIIGARDDNLQFTGIAPEVTFGAYRIFGCEGSSSDDVIMAAMERAYADGMDIVNLSLGDVGWPESPASLLADELALKGMIVCAAAGNEGDKGMFEVGAPSLGKHALSIASVDNTNVLSHTIKIQDSIIGYTTASGAIFNISDTNIVSLSNDFLADRDGCQAITADVKGKVVLVARGGCMFTQKILNAQHAGAVAIVLYNSNPGPMTPSVPANAIHIPYGGISKEDGYNLFRMLQQQPGNQIMAEFLKEDQSFPVPTAGSISAFSSWGLGPDLSLKPDISAPGGQIYSTYPLALGSYATLSGTSMASPYVAGVVALLQQSRGGNRSISAKEVRAMLINNGHPFTMFGTEELESVARQGSGLIDVYQAVRSDTVVMPEQIRLNDMEHSAENHEYTFVIKNNGRLASEYMITHMHASTAQGFEHNPASVKNISPLKKPIILAKHQVEAIVDIPEQMVTVEANQEVNVTVRIQPPINAMDVPPCIYSGYLMVTKNQKREDVIYVPYAGFTSNLNKLPVLIMNGTMPQLLSQHINAFSPALVTFQLAEASPLVTITAVSASDTSQIHGFIPGGYATYVGRNTIDDMKDVMVMSWYGNVASTPEQAALGPMHHSTIQKYKSTNLATTMGSKPEAFNRVGAKLEKGTYKLKLMALRPFGDSSDERDFDIWYSPDITLD